MKIATEKEKCFLEDFVVEELENAFETQHEITEYARNTSFTKLDPILLVLDNNRRPSRYSKSI